MKRGEENSVEKMRGRGEERRGEVKIDALEKEEE